MKRRILFARRTYVFGGTEIRLLDWLTGLDYSSQDAFVLNPLDLFSERIRRRSVPATVVPLDPGRRRALFGYYAEPGVTGVRKPHPREVFWTWFRSLRDLKLDTVVMMDGTFFDFPLPCVMAAWAATRGNLYMTEHLALVEGPPAKRSRKHLGLVPGAGLWWYRAVWKWRLRGHLSRRVLAASESVCASILRYYRYPAHKMAIINHGVDVDRYAPSLRLREEWRKANGIPSTALVMVSTARLSPEKHIDWVLRAFYALAGVRPDCFLVVAGDGPLRQDVEQWVASGPVPHRVKLLGHVEDVGPVLCASDIYLLASMNEGFGIALTEAMASGLVCIATRTAGPDGVLGDPQNGFLVDVSEQAVTGALLQAATLEAHERGLIGARARERVLERYTLPRAMATAFPLMGLRPAQRAGGA